MAKIYRSGGKIHGIEALSVRGFAGSSAGFGRMAIKPVFEGTERGKLRDQKTNDGESQQLP
jgi:hypothetical protein